MAKRKARVEIAPFDASDYLNDREVIADYLAAALEDPDPNVFLRAVVDVAKARGVSEVAKASGLRRESLHKTLASGAKIRAPADASAQHHARRPAKDDNEVAASSPCLSDRAANAAVTGACARS
jgi:probable addiction module antidote protein